MKFSALALCLIGLASAAPHPNIEARAAVTDRPIGFASMNGGTTGGAGGAATTVSTIDIEASMPTERIDQLVAAVAGDAKKIVYLAGPITGARTVEIGSNTSLLGKNSKAVLTGIGLRIKNRQNVIVRNIGLSKVLTKTGDAVFIWGSTNVWIDHVDLSSELGKADSLYDGLIDINHAADLITISNSRFHDHTKVCLIGHADNNKAEDSGHLRVTYHDNLFENLRTRTPSIRYGTAHVFNNYYKNVELAVNTRLNAQVLVEANVFEGVSKPIYSTDAGYAVAVDNALGTGANTAPKGSLTSVPYKYTKKPVSAVKGAVIGSAGMTLSF
ncbi:putative pectate lyase A [Diplocarpon rosae]|nr:putative pectate lyase A [Diplocarpon rosae]